MAGSIHLKYFRDIIPASVISSLELELEELEIDFRSTDITGEPQASAEELIAPIVLFLSSKVVQACLLGIVVSTTYDIIKASVLSIWNSVSGKSLRKITPGGETTVSVNFDLDIRTVEGTRVKFKLKGDMPDDLKNKCIDKAFQLIQLKTFPEIRTGYICLYDVKEDSWKIYEDVEFVRKFIEPKMANKSLERDAKKHGTPEP